MYGAIIGDMVGFPYEYRQEDLTDTELPLLRRKESVSDFEKGAAQAGEDFSDKTVMTAAVGAGLLRFERVLPGIIARNTESGNAVNADTPDAGIGKKAGSPESGQNAAVRTAGDGARIHGVRVPQNVFEESYKKELVSALRSFGQKYPLAGYTMDLSIWLFRGGAGPAQTQDAGPAARVSPIAWMFQDDLYMMRHMARIQAGLTHRGKESVAAAEAAACAVFLAIHGCTKPYISGYLEREFGCRITDEEEMRREILRAGKTWMPAEDAGRNADGASGAGLPLMTVRAAMTAFLNGRDFEDVLRRAVSQGGNSADIAAIAGSVAEAFFGIPQDLTDTCMRRLPADLREAAEAFDSHIAQKKAARENTPAAKERWDNALTCASSRHPAAVQGNELLEQAIDSMREKRDRQSFLAALESVRLRMNQKGRVFVPLVSAKRAGTAETADTSPDRISKNTMLYSMRTIRTKDGKLWQPAYTSRAQLDKAKAATAKAGTQTGDPSDPGHSTGMVLSYAMDALFRRFLPVGTERTPGAMDPDGQDHFAAREIIPPGIQGIVLNPYDKAFFLPRKTIEAIFVINREAAGADPRTDTARRRSPQNAEKAALHKTDTSADNNAVNSTDPAGSPG